MTIELKAKHFKDTRYHSNYDCPVARALKEQGFENPNVGGTRLWLGDTLYHLEYFYMDFSDDMEKAKELNFDNTSLRTLTIKEDI